jgi:hypothetical protein
MMCELPFCACTWDHDANDMVVALVLSLARRECARSDHTKGQLQ